MNDIALFSPVLDIQIFTVLSKAIYLDYLHGIIYVKTTPEKCLSQIEYRNRKGEESIPLDYLENCHKYHEEWINNTNIKRFYLNNIDFFNLSDTLLLNLKDFINQI